MEGDGSTEDNIQDERTLVAEDNGADVLDNEKQEGISKELFDPAEH